MRGVFRQRLQHHRRLRHVIEQRVEVVVEERQPVFHAGMPAAFAHGVVERIVRRGGAEGFHITAAEALDGLGGQLEFRHRHQVKRAQRILAALRFRIEGADRFQCVAKKIEPHRHVHARREQINDTAAHRVIAGLAHGRGADKAVELQPACDSVHVEQVAGRGDKRLLRQHVLGRDAQQRCVDSGEQDRRPLMALFARQPRESDHALRHDTGMRRNTVVRQAVPGR
jgi:hypothetical protein